MVNIQISSRLFLIFITFLTHFSVHAQWRNMNRFTSYGVVNYHTQVIDEKSAKRVILETISMNSNFDEKNITFNKGSNIYMNQSIVDPLNHNYVYVIHAIHSIQGDSKALNIFFYYIENRLRYFYEIDSGNERIFLKWDPAFVEVEK